MARIGIVIYSLAGAGAERVSVNLAHEFVSAGHDVDFVLASGEGELKCEVPAEAGVYLAQTVSANSWRATIGEYVKTHSPKVLLAMMEGAGVLSIQAVKRCGPPVYVVSHIHFSRHCRHAPRWKERWFMPLAVRWWLPRAAGVIGVSLGVSEDIRRSAKLGDAQVHTIYNPVLTPVFRDLARMPAEHPWLVVKREWLTVVTVGRLTAQKDHTNLLRAVRIVDRSRPVRLLILGQGEMRAALEQEASDLGIEHCVEFVGFVRNPYAYISAADVFALSSAWEGLPTVLIEALGAGAAVVSTDCPSGPREILANGQFGQLVPVGDSEALAEGIARIGDQQIDKAALGLHLKQFESKYVAHQYLSLMGLTEMDRR